MDTLKEHIGKAVTVEYVSYGIPRLLTAKLRSVTDFRHIEIEGMGIPFVGNGSAIRSITSSGKAVYENQVIQKNYDVRGYAEIEEYVRRSFGSQMAQRRRDERVAYEKSYQERKDASDRAARESTSRYVIEGTTLVKPELVNEWKEYVTKNTQDGYSAGVVDTVVRGMRALSEGKTPKQVEETWDGSGITGFMAGRAASAIAHFSPRGGEFKAYWNRQFGVGENVEGTINTAILTVDRRE